MDLRRARPDDVEAAARVHDAARRAYYAAAGVDVGAPDPRRRDTWQALVEDPGRTVWLAARGSEVIGVLAAGRPLHPWPADDPVRELIALYVDPSAWGAGAGSALHDVFRAELAAGAWAAGVLDVWDRNDRALAFWSRHGWLPDGRSRPGDAGTAYRGLRLPRGR